MPCLLFEIGTEELPAFYAMRAIEQLKTLAESLLKEAGMEFSSVSSYGTPRRIVLSVAGLLEKQPDAAKEISGPPKKIAFDANNNPTRALESFLKNQNASISDLKFKSTPKGEFCSLNIFVKGRTTLELLPEVLTKICASLAFPKSMHWIKGSTFSFARPVRHILALLDDKVVDFSAAGLIRAKNTVPGHQFLSGQTVAVPDADIRRYIDLMKSHCVYIDQNERKSIIKDKINSFLAKNGTQFREDDNDLLDEVTFLVEYPNVIECAFDEHFLSVPEAVLVTSMREHQRYFPVWTGAGKLANRFISVINRTDEFADAIREGNQRVLRARLTDAKFFYENDMKIPLKNRVHSLKDVVFLKGMGTYFDKTHRLEHLASFLLKKTVPGNEMEGYVDRAALLCKADLLTEMVGEFPNLQGVMGYEYGIAQDEPPEVCIAIKEHYQPRTQNDQLPQSPAGTVLSLAEKYDNICAVFALGMKPTGSADPYALRRQTIAIISIILQQRLSFSQKEMVGKAISLLPDPYNKKDISAEIFEFIRERLYQICIDKGCPYDIVRGTLSSGFDNILDFYNRLQALSELSQQDWWQSLVAVVERTYNIYKNCRHISGRIDPELLVENEEKEVFDRLNTYRAEIELLVANREYKKACIRYNEVFSKPVHAFFEKVFVNVDDQKVRMNRMFLMKELNELFIRNLADLSAIVAK